MYVCHCIPQRSENFYTTRTQISKESFILSMHSFDFFICSSCFCMTISASDIKYLRSATSRWFKMNKDFGRVWKRQKAAYCLPRRVCFHRVHVGVQVVPATITRPVRCPTLLHEFFIERSEFKGATKQNVVRHSATRRKEYSTWYAIWSHPVFSWQVTSSNIK